MDFKIEIKNTGDINKYLKTSLANKITKIKEYTKKKCYKKDYMLTKGIIDYYQVYYDSYVSQETCTVNETKQMTSYYPQYCVLPTYNHNVPVLFPDWSTVASTIQAAPVFSPGIINVSATPQAYTSIYPYTGTILGTEPVLNPVIPNPVSCLPNASSYLCAPEVHCIEEIHDHISDQNESVFEIAVSEDSKNCDLQSRPQTKDPIELFISLPKELFPSARTQIVDPNPIIDQLCQVTNINSALNWILDLEFGLPRVPVTRSIAVYNVKNNNICCKNSPKVHPDFETCSTTFKEVILCYYKRIMYQWYKGYVIMNHDKSLENFQMWLLLPMHLLGMGWR